MDNDVIDVQDKSRNLQSGKTLTLVLYVLYGLGFFWGVTAIAAIVTNYVKRDDVSGTWLESHFVWQMRTFWFSVLWCIVAMVCFVTVLLIPISWLIGAVLTVWVIYRLVKGFLYLQDNKPIE